MIPVGTMLWSRDSIGDEDYELESITSSGVLPSGLLEISGVLALLLTSCILTVYLMVNAIIQYPRLILVTDVPILQSCGTKYVAIVPYFLPNGTLCYAFSMALGRYITSTGLRQRHLRMIFFD